MRVFVPLWSPPEGVHAGGFYRARRLLESWPSLEVVAVRNRAFRLDPRPWIADLTYPSPLYARRPGLFELARAANWLWSAVALTVRGLACRGSIDAVYVPTSEILPCTLAGLLVGRLRRVPVVLCNLNVRDVPMWGLNRRLHALADAIVTLSPALRDELLAEGLSVPISIGFTGVDDESVAPRASRFDGAYVGRLTEAKGAYDLIEIWRRVVLRRPGARLALMGFATDAMAADLKGRIAAAGLAGDVELLGSGSDAEKWQLYAETRCCLFASHVEGWGIVPIEAALAGVPTVAYELPAYSVTIAGQPDFSLVRDGDTEAFADAVLAFLDRGETRSASQSWARRFAWESVAENEADLLRALARTANAR